MDKSLQRRGEAGRKRFTMAHEAGHYIMDRTVTRASFHREYDRERAYSPQELKELLSFREARVDRLAAALLMPRFMVREVLGRFGVFWLIPIYGDNLLRLEDKLLVQKMARAMGVSYTAFLIRLKELSLMERHDISEYIIIDFGNLLLRRKEIYETLHPETKAGTAQAIGMNKAVGNNVAEKFSATSKSFVDDTAEKLGVTPRTVICLGIRRFVDAAAMH